MDLYKPSKFNIKIEKKEGRVNDKWTIFIDGTYLTPLEVSNKYKIPREAVYAWLNNKTLEQFSRWLENRADLVQLGLPPTTSRLYRKGNEVCWLALVAAEVECTHYEARKRLHAWETGDVDCDTLFAPPMREWKEGMRNPGGPNWGNLSDDEREYNLNKIADGGSWEEEHVPLPADGAGKYSRDHFICLGPVFLPGGSDRIPLMRGD